MAGDIEFGTCDVCHQDKNLNRKYYRYNIQCDCCNSKKDNHFEIVRHCNTCVPAPPINVLVNMKHIEE